jgi:hypothetical protein
VTAGLARKQEQGNLLGIILGVLMQYDIRTQPIAVRKGRAGKGLEFRFDRYAFRGQSLSHVRIAIESRLPDLEVILNHDSDTVIIYMAPRVSEQSYGSYRSEPDPFVEGERVMQYDELRDMLDGRPSPHRESSAAEIVADLLGPVSEAYVASKTGRFAVVNYALVHSVDPDIVVCLRGDPHRVRAFNLQSRRFQEARRPPPTKGYTERRIDSNWQTWRARAKRSALPLIDKLSDLGPTESEGEFVVNWVKDVLDKARTVGRVPPELATATARYVNQCRRNVQANARRERRRWSRMSKSQRHEEATNLWAASMALE